MTIERRALDELVRATSTRSIGRRGLLRGASLSMLAIGAPGLLAACGTESQKQTEDSCRSTDRSAEEKELTFSNWPEYIDVKGKSMPSLDRFQQETGISVTYNTDINDNNQFFAKVKDQLGACEPIDRDLISMTDWMAARMIGLGWMQELDHANLPNVDANLRESLKSPNWDPERKYSVPWQSGVTGIAYNAKYVDEVRTFEELTTRSDLKGRMSLLLEMNDTMGFMLLLEGADPEDFTEDEWGAAIDRLDGIVQSGQVRRFTGNDYIRDLKSGNLVACEAWSGDVIAAQFDDPDIKFVVPEEGLGLWSDNLMVPNKAEHKTNAEALMNYYYDPVNAATLAAWVNYICPVEGAQEAMEQIDPSLVDSPLIFPDAEFLAGTFIFQALEEKTCQSYEKLYNQVIGG
jgi:spermidine/putrescine transport system substrate-binding protein